MYFFLNFSLFPSPQQFEAFPGTSQVAQMVKNLPAMWGTQLRPLSRRSGRSPGEGDGYPLQYPCLENSTDRVLGVAKNQTRLNNEHFGFFQWCLSSNTFSDLPVLFSFFFLHSTEEVTWPHVRTQVEPAIRFDFHLHHMLAECLHLQSGGKSGYKSPP